MRKSRTEAQKQAASVAMKKQWTEVRAMRKTLSVPLDSVVAYYVRLRDAGLIKGVMEGDPESVRDAKELMESKSAGPLFGEPGIMAVPESFNACGETRKHTNNIPGLNDIKIMLWAIEKIGSTSASRVAFDKAMESLS